jgi:hypothetical protein
LGYIKKINLIVFLGALFSYVSLQCQEEVVWTPDFRFSWNDFKGSVPKSSSAAATTASGISYDFSTFYDKKKLKIDYNVYAYFYPLKSWYKPQLCNDIYHMQIMEGDIIRNIQDYHQYYGHYHTGGNPGRHEIDETQEIFYPAVMKAILKTGYTGHVAQEFVPSWDDKIAALKQGVTICDV